MKLEKIKLSGFKSFVDPTTIPINGNLTAIVGPNGCGKSNIIDAVRWVMGESSAKHLRGGSMADVVFNGSSTRKPVSTAFVELVFDNSEGRAAGEFAKYNTISIKRQVSREGQSLYQLNGSRCRRKDITDLFLGTGLGSRSYAIIEQGTISRVVEAKPEELRVHIEEAAGISKYKERRQETETRMRHTRENLDRLEDLREEVGKQLENLKKQADKAEKYTELKAQERRYKEEHLAMRWQNYHQIAEQLDEKLQEIAEQHNRLFVSLRETEQQIDEKRQAQKQQQSLLDEAQADYYHSVAEVSRLQQAIKHNEQSHADTLAEIERLREQTEHSLAECEQDSLQLEEIKTALLEAEESLIIVREQEQEAGENQQQSLQKMQGWRQQWEDFLAENARYNEINQVQRVKLNQLQNQNQQLQIRLDKLQSEQVVLAETALQSEIAELEVQVEEMEERRLTLSSELEQQNVLMGEQRQQIKMALDQLHQYRSDMHSVQGKITSLEMLQQHAMGKDKKELEAWLTRMDLDKQPRLAEFMDVENGWETAVETVLAHYLEAVCVDDWDNAVAGLQFLQEQDVILFNTAAEPVSGDERSLLSKIRCQWDLSPLLSGILYADDLQQAQTMQKDLAVHQSIILPDGTWLGQNWLKVSRSVDSKSGVLQREKELRSLKQRQQELDELIEQAEIGLEESESALKSGESLRESLQQQDKALAAELSQQNAQLSAHQARHEHQQQRLQQVENEMSDIQFQLTENAEFIAEAEQLQQDAEQRLETLDARKKSLEENNQQLLDEQQKADMRVQETRQQVHNLQSKIESLRSSETLTMKQIERLQTQNQQSSNRIQELESRLQMTLSPMGEEKQQLQAFTERKVSLEQKLQQAREQQQSIDEQIAHLSEQQISFQRGKDQQKERLDEVRFQQQDSRVRQQTLTEQMQEMDADPEQILKNLPEQAEEQTWKTKLESLVKQIERLGSINLTAIEEYQSQSERINFLNEQHTDLINALDTLEQAINKIDKESRLRFKETFDKINSGLQEKFPRLFGGGQAYLELTEQDLLETGVNIIARPPGKRNSSIHLLSGGEKALTAVALVFSIFDLNPAPFCLLDEVDAPLDDANVVRFSQMVEDMSASVQFLYISHNKVTMEIAKNLAGVTMKEPGVSRMVAVDIEEAVVMAES